MLYLSDFLKYFKKVKREGEGYKAECPCHTDDTPSLSISQGKNNNIVLHCHAGCNTSDILNEIGLKWEDITKDKPAVTWVTRIERCIGKELEKEYKYYNEKGRYLYSKLRFKGKHITYGILDETNDNFKLGLNGIKKTLYNLPKLIKAVKEGYPVYIAEGEKDADTLNNLGYTATTCGGCGDWRKEYSRYFKSAKVIILPDNDESGLKLKDTIIKDLKYYAHSIKWTITSQNNKGDVTDYLTKEGNTKEELEEIIKKANEILAPWLYHNSSGDLRINGDILANCISKSLNIIILKKRGIDKEDIYIYENGVYNLCTKNSIKTYIREYIPVGHASDNTLNNTYNLILCSGDNTYPFETVNSKEHYINVKNGLFNIKTRKLEPHTSKYLSTVQLNCSYDENCPPPYKWLKFVNQLCMNTEGEIDKQKIAVLQEWGGLILSNITVFKVKEALVLFSALGNTGKSVYLDILVYLLGADNTINIPFQKMSDNFSLSALYGKRADIVGDQKALDIDDSSVFKQLTGGDTVEVEFKGKTKFSYIFKGGIMIACNNLPVFKDDKGGHIFERMNIIPCENVIPKEKRNSNLRNELKEEADGIFKWCLEGLYRLINNNYRFTECQAREDITRELRTKVDTIYRYVSENCEITGSKSDRIKKTEFEANYIKWCTFTECRNVNKREIAERMRKIGIECGKTGEGVFYYKGVKYNNETLNGNAYVINGVDTFLK